MTRHSWTAGFRNSCEESWQQQCLLLCVLQSGGESCRTFVLKQILSSGKKTQRLALESATYLHCTCWRIVNPDHVCWFYTFASMERRKCFKRLRFDFLTPCFLPLYCYHTLRCSVTKHALQWRWEAKAGGSSVRTMLQWATGFWVRLHCTSLAEVAQARARARLRQEYCLQLVQPRPASGRNACL